MSETILDVLAPDKLSTKCGHKSDSSLSAEQNYLHGQPTGSQKIVNHYCFKTLSLGIVCCPKAVS